MRTHVQKMENSLAVRIPKSFAKQLNLAACSEVNLNIEKGRLVIIKSTGNLEALLDQITPQNIHSLALEDAPQGKEEWLTNR